jgi:hypothetical protein
MDAEVSRGGRSAAADSLRSCLCPSVVVGRSTVVKELSASDDLNLCVNVRTDNDGFARV